MKTQHQCRTFTQVLLAAVLLTAASQILAQDATTNSAPVAPATADAPANAVTVTTTATNTLDATPASTISLAPQLSYGVSSIVQLTQAKVDDSTIVKYIQTGGSGFGLDADQIIYLKQQGVSDAVVNAMLSQPSQASAGTVASTPVAPAAPVNPAPATDYSTPSLNADYPAAAPVADAPVADAPVADINPAPIPPVSVYVTPAPPINTFYCPPVSPYPYYRPGYVAASSVSVVYIGGGYARHNLSRPAWRH